MFSNKNMCLYSADELPRNKKKSNLKFVCLLHFSEIMF